ncbi:flagellar export chaperone FliS [Brenneria goodwinii]|nr:flagellar export chaperone FliS [Brenneria goodwinii]MCG8158140.1 flagellar export chaperone FliS [Brenneria goodwinii]MCG8162481.1 flagellar export chaperone FliS [Brenneria goodwinii]MCG8167191.1 flagellar export chaperone FliS [Brenneria goodwinii]MCG8171851.1 flagellar export chaperone FliS [Brenneria goodwinii]MCG8176517.1 flagellar export chaperone FliS [Brenneria goodwinii]
MYGSQAYAKVGLESSVMSASPHQLITLLFDGALSALMRADIFIQEGDTVAKGNALTKAIKIINSGLQASLDMEKGGEVSQNLAQLYDYMVRKLLHVNLYNDRETLAQITELLRGIADAWKQIDENAPAQAKVG